MKRLFIIGCMLITQMVIAQSPYEASMTKELQKFKAAKTMTELNACSATFEKIAATEKTQWLPYYYAALASLSVAYKDPTADKDKIAEKSKSLILKAEAMEKNNAELFCLRQMIAMQRIFVDPPTRWDKYSAEAMDALKNALKADPNNPRIYYLAGLAKVSTPESLGGGKGVAKIQFEKALSLFKTYKLVSPLYPNWGKDDTERFLAACQ